MPKFCNPYRASLIWKSQGQKGGSAQTFKKMFFDKNFSKQNNLTIDKMEWGTKETRFLRIEDDVDEKKYILELFTKWKNELADRLKVRKRIKTV